MTQHHAISSSRPTASHGSAGARPQQAGSSAPPDGFASLLLALGQDEQPLFCAPHDAAPAGLLQAGQATAAGAGEVGHSGLVLSQNDGLPLWDNGEQLSKSKQPNEFDSLGAAEPAGLTAQPPDPAMLALLLAGQGPVPTLPQGQAAGAAGPTAEAAVEPHALSTGTTTMAANALMGPQAQTTTGLAMASGVAGTASDSASDAGHWLPAGLISETSRIDSASGLAPALPESAQSPAPTRPGAARAGRFGAAGAAAGLAGGSIGSASQAGHGAGQVGGGAASQGMSSALASATAASAAGTSAASEAGSRAAGREATAQGPAGSTGPTGHMAQWQAWAEQVSGEVTTEAASATRTQGAGAGAGPHAASAPGEAPPPETADNALSAMSDTSSQGGADAGDPQAQLAERVAYWVHQQTQNAALTLDRDGQPVQVQVSLTGDQAHITFRSDEAQARQLLDAGSAELRALLDAQGVQLAGVTVDQSHAGQGRQDPGRQGEPADGQPANARRGLVRVAEAGGMAVAGTARGVQGVGQRSVDVFV